MKRWFSAGLITVTVLCLMLTACNDKTTTSISSSTNGTTSQLTLPNQGNIRVDGRGYFNYQRVLKPITGPTTYQGVTFTPFTYGPGTTITAPVGYWFTVTFADESSDELQYIGFGDTNNININITEHANPSAGILMFWQDIGGSLKPVMYLLVSE